MAPRPRLLFLAQCLPYPPHSGVAVRTFNVLRQLQEAYDIDLVTFYRINHQPDQSARNSSCAKLRSVAEFVAEPSPIPNEHSLARKLGDHIRSVVSGRSYTYYEYDSRAFGRRLRHALRARAPDLVHLDSLDLHRWLPELPRVPITCTHHDIDSELLRLRARRLNQPIGRNYLRLQAARSERVMRQLCPGFAVNVMMSEVDAGRLRAIAGSVATLVVPNGTDTEYFRPNGTKSVAGRVAFVGPTHSFPNRDAVDFLVQEIWPRIHAADRATSLRLIGRNAPGDQARYAAEAGVIPLGHVADVRPALAEASCCVVPIRVGGGTRLKILDAWAMGKAVVSTSLGCEGLDAVDGDNILIRDTPMAMADGVAQVLGDRQLRTRLEQNARRTALETYSWRIVGSRMRAAYDELLGRAPTRPLAR
jgi:glycosyltransferase involved in cell wall biosynthesis